MWKLDSAGDLVWAKQLGGPNADQSNGVAVDTDGNVHTTGSFGHVADFDPGPGTLYVVTNAVGSSVFVSKLDSSGNLPS